jgi:hypothetical protein
MAQLWKLPAVIMPTVLEELATPLRMTCVQQALCKYNNYNAALPVVLFARRP